MGTHLFIVLTLYFSEYFEIFMMIFSKKGLVLISFPQSISSVCSKLVWVVLPDKKDSIISDVWEVSEVTQSCLTLCNPMDCSLPDSSDFPGKILE